MTDRLESLAIAEPQLELIVPETLAGGELSELYREFTHEMWVDRLNSALTVKRGADGSVSGALSISDAVWPHAQPEAGTLEAAVTAQGSKRRGNVCFLVRTYDTSVAEAKSDFIHYGLSDFIYCKSAIDCNAMQFSTFYSCCFRL